MLASDAVLACGMCYVWLAFGIYFEREFGDAEFFQKHRLSPRFFFCSPVGERDPEDLHLTQAEEQAERDYDEFVGAWLEQQNKLKEPL